MAEGLRAAVRLMARRLSDTPSGGRSGEELAQATGLRVRAINQAVDGLEGSGDAHMDRALGGSPSLERLATAGEPRLGAAMQAPVREVGDVE